MISFTLPEAQELDQVEEMLSRFGTVKEVYFYNKTNTRVNAMFNKFSEAANCVEQLGEYSAYLVVPKHKPERGIYYIIIIIIFIIFLFFNRLSVKVYVLQLTLSSRVELLAT